MRPELPVNTPGKDDGAKFWLDCENEAGMQRHDVAHKVHQSRGVTRGSDIRLLLYLAKTMVTTSISAAHSLITTVLSRKKAAHNGDTLS